MSETTIEAPVVEDIKPQSQGVRWSNVILWAAIIFVLALLGWGLMDANATRPEAGQAAPDFAMEFFNGYEWEARPVADLAEMEGQVVVLNFWASWCVECRLEADLLENTWRRYKDQGVVFLGIAYVDVEPKSLSYLEAFNITYPNAPDLGSRISSDYEITGVPETFFVDKSGEIAYVQIGPVDETTMNGLIEQLLAE